MGENLAGGHVDLFAESFHLRPNLLPRQGFAASGEKNLARGDFVLSGVLQQFLAEFSGNQDGAHLTFQTNLRLALMRRLYGQVFHL